MQYAVLQQLWQNSTQISNRATSGSAEAKKEAIQIRSYSIKLIIKWCLYYMIDLK